MKQTSLYHPSGGPARGSRFGLLSICAVLAAQATVWAAAPTGPQNKITARVYERLSGTAISDLTNSPAFPNSPTLVRQEPYFELWAGGAIDTAAASDVLNYYGANLEGYFYPPSTGNYTFYLCSDDLSVLYLSTDDNPVNKKLIAMETVWSNPREYTSSGGASVLESKRSDQFTNSAWPSQNVITLQAGKAYYIQALQKEGSGGDNLSVSIDGTLPIPGSNLAPYSWTTAPTVTQVAAPAENVIQLTYSEPVGASAETAANYSIDNGLTVSAVKRLNASTVQLSTSAQTAGTTYTVTINGVQDLSPTPNTIAANTKVTYVPGYFVPSVVIHKFWDGITDNTIGGVTNNARFPDQPTYGVLLPSFEYPQDNSGEGGSSYGDQLIAWFSPPQTGDYTFFVCGDDYAQLFLSTDDNPANKKLIAYENGWSGQRAWTTTGSGDPASKRSDQYTDTQWPSGGTITLTKGKKYYLEAVHSEGGGGDSVGATFVLATAGDPTDGTAPTLTGSVVSAFIDPNGASLSIVGQPKDATVLQSRSTTLSVSVKAASAYGTNVVYQWQKAAPGSADFVNITNGTAWTYTTPALTLSESGSQYRCVVSNLLVAATSTAAKVTVQADTVAPKLSKVAVSALQAILVNFDEALDKTSAETAANYAISDGVSVTQATLGSSGNTVLLTTTALTANKQYTLTVGGIKDLFNNAMAAGTTLKFVSKVVSYADIILADGPLAFYRFEETSGSVAKNSGSTGGDGAYYVGDEGAPGDGGALSSPKGDPGPRPPTFLGFDSVNRSATFGGSATQDWIDTKNQFLNNCSAFTLEYWVMPTIRLADPTAFGTRIGIVGQNDAVEYGFIDNNTIQIWTPGGGSLDTDYNYADNEWHHVATIADGSSIKNYFDGVLVGSGGSSASNYGSSSYFVHIGGGGVYDVTGNYFTGQIDEVAIFDKAIPAARIAAHYKAGKEGGALPSAEPATFTQIQLAGGKVTLAWTGEGTLQEATDVNGPWTAAAVQDNPQTLTPTGNKYYRIVQ